MNRTMQSTADDLLARYGTGLTRWVLGLGLLSLHATVYTITMIALVLWNIYSSPGDLWIDEVFYRWSAILAFHAIAVVCGWTAWRLMRSEQAAMLDAQREWSAVPTRSEAVHGYERPVEPSGWQMPSLQGASLQRYSASVQKIEYVAKRVLGSSAAWSNSLVRRSMVVVMTTTTKLTQRNGTGSVDQPQPAVVDPTQTWPESPVRHRSAEDEFVTRFAGTQEVATQVEQTWQAQVTESNEGTEDVVLDVSGFSTRTEATQQTTAHIVKGPGQSWVEAATSAWHSAHLSGEAAATEHNHQNGQSDSSSETTPPAQ